MVTFWGKVLGTNLSLSWVNYHLSLAFYTSSNPPENLGMGQTFPPFWQCQDFRSTYSCNLYLIQGDWWAGGKMRGMLDKIPGVGFSFKGWFYGPFWMNFRKTSKYSEVYLSKEYFCKMYPTCVSSKLCEFISDVFLIFSIHEFSWTSQAACQLVTTCFH